MDKIRKFLLGIGDFKSEDQIRQLIKQAEEYDPQRENVDNAEALLIFQTSRQQTWLVATNRRLYCVLDDLNRSFTRVQWSIRAETLCMNGRVTIDITTDNDYTARSGLLNIGRRRDWLYSKKLFTVDNIEDKIREMITRNMVGCSGS